MEAAQKTEYTKEFKLHEKDTGSADVQIALLTHQALAKVQEGP